MSLARAGNVPLLERRMFPVTRRRRCLRIRQCLYRDQASLVIQMKNKLFFFPSCLKVPCCFTLPCDTPTAPLPAFPSKPQPNDCCRFSPGMRLPQGPGGASLLACCLGLLMLHRGHPTWLQSGRESAKSASALACKVLQCVYTCAYRKEYLAAETLIKSSPRKLFDSLLLICRSLKPFCCIW